MKFITFPTLHRYIHCFVYRQLCYLQDRHILVHPVHIDTLSPDTLTVHVQIRVGKQGLSESFFWSISNNYSVSQDSTKRILHEYSFTCIIKFIKQAGKMRF